MEGLKWTSQRLGSVEGCGEARAGEGNTIAWRGRGGLTGSGPGNPIPLGPRGASPQRRLREGQPLGLRQPPLGQSQRKTEARGAGGREGGRVVQRRSGPGRPSSHGRPGAGPPKSQGPRPGLGVPRLPALLTPPRTM